MLHEATEVSDVLSQTEIGVCDLEKKPNAGNPLALRLFFSVEERLLRERLTVDC